MKSRYFHIYKVLLKCSLLYILVSGALCLIISAKLFCVNLLASSFPVKKKQEGKGSIWTNKNRFGLHSRKIKLRVLPAFSHLLSGVPPLVLQMFSCDKTRNKTLSYHPATKPAYTNKVKEIQ